MGLFSYFYSSPRRLFIFLSFLIWKFQVLTKTRTDPLQANGLAMAAP